MAGAGVLAARNPGMLGKAAEKLGAIRQQLMLSGWAPLKSVLGNVGAATYESAERGSMAPLREFFSPQTAQDFKAAWRGGTPAALQGPALKVMGKELPTPGRFMGAMDDATQKALQRSGMTSEETARATLQTPLGGQLGKALDSPAARYLIPFRRTPFNQFFEGFETMKPANIKAHPAVMGATAAAGAVHGAATSDERYPVSLGFGTAFAGRYGVPYTLSALAGRELAGARSTAGIAGTVLPVSEYGLESGIRDPLQAFRDPAALRALRQLIGEKK